MPFKSCLAVYFSADMSRDYALSSNPKGAEQSSISAVRAKIEGSSADLPIESDQHSNERRHQHAHDHFADGLRGF